MLYYWVITVVKSPVFSSWSMAKAFILSQPYPARVVVKREVVDWAGNVDFMKVGSVDVRP